MFSSSTTVRVDFEEAKNELSKKEKESPTVQFVPSKKKAQNPISASFSGGIIIFCTL
jgi:hypothetical protein